MNLRLVPIIAAFAGLTLLGACGGPDTPATDPGPAASAAADSAASGTVGSAAEAEADAAAAAEAVVESAGRFKLGQHYSRLSPTQRTLAATSDEVEVTEAFWYGCPHCYEAEAFFQRWLASKPDYVRFVRLPITWDQVPIIHARLYYTVEELGKLEEMHTAIFDAIHQDQNLLLSEDALIEFFARFDVSAEQFLEVWNSEDVRDTKLRRAFEFMQRYEIRGVPAVIINGKYVTGVSEAGGHAELFELINELAAAEHARE